MYKRFSEAFTLPEIMTVIAVIGVVIAVGLPSFESFVLQSRATSSINDLGSSLKLARSESIKRQRPVAVCTSVDGASCSAASTWDRGWIVFVNDDADTPPVIDAGEEILFVHPRLSGNGVLIGGLGTQSFVNFSSSGMPVQLGSFLYCDTRGDSFSRAMEMSLTGRLKIVDALVTDPALSCA